jgi:hypothetical protein
MALQAEEALGPISIPLGSRNENIAKENICRRYLSDKNQIKLYSSENNMNPGKLPSELCDMTIIEQQLISKITVHLLKHGGVAPSGHCGTPTGSKSAITNSTKTPQRH